MRSKSRNRTAAERWLSRGGFALGLVLVAAGLFAWRVPLGEGKVGADLLVSVAPTGELGLSRTGPFLRTSGLGPGGSAYGAVDVVNQTGRGLAVALRAVPSGDELDRILVVSLEAGRERVFQGTLAGLRRWSRREVVLAPGERRTLHLRARLAPGVRGYEGRIVSVTLELRSSRRAA